MGKVYSARQFGLILRSLANKEPNQLLEANGIKIDGVGAMLRDWVEKLRIDFTPLNERNEVMVRFRGVYKKEFGPTLYSKSPKSEIKKKKFDFTILLR